MSQDGKRKVLIGWVTSDKMNKTRIITTDRLARHSFYGKVIKKKKKFYAHDEKNQSHTGDRVKIVETRPLSKLKRWRILEIISSYRNLNNSNSDSPYPSE